MRNRWVVLTAGCLIQTILGGIYAWSAFVPYLMKGYPLSRGQCGLIFGVAILAFTLTMILAGRVLSRKGPRLTAAIGAVLFAAGYMLASLSEGSYLLLLMTLGVTVGAGIGFGYVCPLSVGMKWFPQKKGLVTGVAVAGFGGGAVLLSSIAEHLLIHGTDVLAFFRGYGLCAGVALLGAAMLLSEPPTPRKPASGSESHAAIFSRALGFTSLGMFAGTFAGLLIIGNLTPLAMEAGLAEQHAVLSVSVFAAGNALGRIAWGHAFDRLGYKSIPISLISFGFAAAILLLPLPEWAFLLIIGFLGFGFGANFVLYASALSRHFGTELFPRLYPLCFLAYGVAGLIGPAVGGFLTDKTNSYDLAIYICIALVLGIGALLTAKLSVFIDRA